jgi:hypothetical protein
VDEVPQPRAGHGRDHDERPARARAEVLDALAALGRLRKVGLVGHDDLWAPGQLRGVPPQLVVDNLEILERITARLRIEVEHVEQKPRALGVTEELMAEPLALGGAGDQAGQIGDHEAPFSVHPHDAERRRQRREGIVGDLGGRGRQPGDERRLAGVGEADHTDVGEELQLEVEPPPLGDPAEIGLARGAIGGRREAGIAPPAGDASHGEDPRSRRGEIAEDLAGVPVRHDRPHGHAKDEIVAAGAVAVRALAVLAARGLVVALIVVVEQRVQGRIGLEPEAPAVAAVAAVGAAAGHVLLTPKADAASSAVTALDEDVDLIDKHVTAWRCARSCGLADARGESRRGRDDAHVARALPPLEPDDAVDLGEERVVGAAAHVGAGLERGAALADEDAASRHQLTGEALHAQHLGIGVPAVSRAADAFFVSHPA